MSDQDALIRRLQERIDYLEEINRHTYDALELASSLGSFSTSINKIDCRETILRETCARTKRLISFETISFFLADETNAEFYPAYCEPPHHSLDMLQEMDALVDKGIFAWALQRRKAVFFPTRSRDKQLLLHVITTPSRVRGMFIGVVEEKLQEIPDSFVSLFSIIMLHTANTLESFELYRWVQQINRELEDKVQNLASSERQLQEGREQLERLVSERTAALQKANEQLREENKERQKAEEALQEAYSQLEDRVEERTAELRASNDSLQREIEERIRAEKEKVQVQSQLLQAQKMESIGHLAGGIAHDFNNLLTAILGYGQLALNRLPNPHPVRDYLFTITNAGEKAATLTRQLLAFSRKQMLEMRVVDLNSVVNDLGKILNRMIGEDIVLECRTEAPVDPIWADPSQLEQIILNLAVNSRDSMPAGGKLAIATANVVFDEKSKGDREEIVDGRYVQLSVSDTGEGIPEELHKLIFEPFFTTKKVGKGTGLGLATVYGIVKQHLGYVYVESEVGRGTNFTLYFPVTERTESGKEKPLPAEVVSRITPATVLVVDDEACILKFVSDTLTPLGYTCLCAATGQEALVLAQRIGPAGIDVLLTDVVMPEMSGKELVARVQEILPDVKVLFMSGYVPEDEQGGQMAAAHVLIPKPLRPDVLAGKLAEALAAKGRPKRGVW